MSTNYDAIAREYQASKLLPWRKHFEAYTYFKLIGSLNEKSVLDLACGDGFYTRQFKLRGAAEVTGVDLSAGMIALAEEAERNNPISLNYICCNVTELKLDRKFDMICASYLLNYAHDIKSLNAMCEAIFQHLKPGGRFITINSNPDYKATINSLLPYGFTRENAGYNEGDEVTYRFYQPDNSFVEVTNYHLKKTTYERALIEAGFSEIQWNTMDVSPLGLGELGTGYWERILEDQPVVGLSCKKLL